MYYLSILPSKYSIIEENANILEPFIKLIYSENKITPDEFFQIYWSSTEISIILPTRLTDFFQTEKVLNNYLAFRCDTENPGLEEIGVLAGITKLFKQYQISLLIISTFNYNYILFPDDFYQTFLKLLHENTDKITYLENYV